MKRTLTLLALLLSLTSYSRDNTDVVVMYIYQNYGLTKIDSWIQISYPDETTQTIELAKAGFGSKDKSEKSNIIIIQQQVNALSVKGYELKSCSVTGDVNFTKTIMIFERQKD